MPPNTPSTSLTAQLTAYPPTGTTDLDAALAIQRTVDGRALFVMDAGPGTWHAFNGTKWVPITKAEMKSVAIAIGKTSAKSMMSAINSAEGLQDLQAHLEDFDHQPYLFNVRNGTLNLDPAPEEIEIEPGRVVTFPPDWSWEFQPHDKADRLSQVAGCDYDHSAQCPQWYAFLRQVLPDPEVREWLQRLIGYAMVGNQTEAVFPVLYGKGANGKSTFVDIVSTLFGDYQCVAEKSLFKTTRGDTHPADRAVLINKRLARSEELPDVDLDEPKIKGLTGGDKISGRGMRENFKEWEPTHTFLAHSNTRPRLSGSDDGIWRRTVIIPFEVKISEAEADPYLRFKLRRELPGILNWALTGYENYCSKKLTRPEVLQTIVSDYRNESDTVNPFVARYEASPGGVVFGLIAEHKEWGVENGMSHDEITKNYKAVCGAMAELGGKTKPTWNPLLGRTQRAWVGVRVKE